MMDKIDITKSIPRDRWGEFFDQFADGNRGRQISIELLAAEMGDESLVQGAPLMALVYDPPGKGDDLTIEVGRDEVNYAHTIDSPVEVYTAQDDNGIMRALEIVDATGNKTLVTLDYN